MTGGFSHGRVRAVLGPTNTGKTYLAIDRMLGYPSGMIGFPLRLLARENYDRIVSLKGRNSVALITGEEKIIPDNPRWFVCTVESMPMDRPVDFLAVDEIQLCGDPERGHIFTQRLLHARGLAETMFLGADTMRPLVNKLVPDAEIDDRKRFSTLRYSGPRKITRLPRRSAVVAFSVDEVYAIAELIRRQRGGTAVVLGALSPRTRNAQVALYQEGEVDYMVATDAIGMGLNMDVDHVAFAGLRKFDGKRPRPLSPAEIGQIAGRAGRHMNDGTFGVTNEVKPLDEEIVEAVENHRFESLKHIYWRNASLDFNSPKRLLKSLEQPPARLDLIPARMADDHDALLQLSADAEIADIATNPAAVRQLWEVCQIPDFRKMLADHHLRLLREVYLNLNRHHGQLPEDWVAAQIGQLEAEAGGIDSLTTRIAHIRTWTYITHRADWLDDSQHWQSRAREIEDRLSDALHQKLTQQFVDRRAALFDRKRGDGELLSAVTAKGILVVEGEKVGRLEGLKFVPSADALADKAIMSAARQALRQDMGTRAAALIDSQDNAFRLDKDGRVLWKRAPVGRLKPGPTALQPEIVLDRNEYLDEALRRRIERRLTDWLRFYLKGEFKPLSGLLAAECPATVRGLLFHLGEGLGSVTRKTVGQLVNGLDREGRAFLKSGNVTIGTTAIYCPALLKLGKIRLRALLWSVANECPVPAVEFERRPTAYDKAMAPAEFWQATGHISFGAVSLRIDLVEKLAGVLRRKSRQGAFLLTPDLLHRAGCDETNFNVVANALGYRCSQDEIGVTLIPKSRPKRKRAAKGKTGKTKARRGRPAPDPNSPFAVLQELVESK